MTTTTVCRVARNSVQPQLSSIESTQWSTGLSHPLTILPISCDVVCNTQYCWGMIVCASSAKQNQHFEQIYVMAYFIKDTDTLRTIANGRYGSSVPDAGAKLTICFPKGRFCTERIRCIGAPAYKRTTLVLKHIKYSAGEASTSLSGVVFLFICHTKKNQKVTAQGTELPLLRSQA